MLSTVAKNIPWKTNTIFLKNAVSGIQNTFLNKTVYYATVHLLAVIKSAFYGHTRPWQSDAAYRRGPSLIGDHGREAKHYILRHVRAGSISRIMFSPQGVAFGPVYISVLQMTKTRCIWWYVIIVLASSSQQALATRWWLLALASEQTQLHPNSVRRFSFVLSSYSEKLEEHVGLIWLKRPRCVDKQHTVSGELPIPIQLASRKRPFSGPATVESWRLTPQWPRMLYGWKSKQLSFEGLFCTVCVLSWWRDTVRQKEEKIRHTNVFI